MDTALVALAAGITAVVIGVLGVVGSIHWDALTAIWVLFILGGAVWTADHLGSVRRL